MRRISQARAIAPTLALTLAALTLQGTALAQTRELATKGQLLDRIAAVVNDGVVLNSDLDEQIAIVSGRMREQKLELPPQNVLRQQVLERLVVQEIQVQQADRAGVKVSDENLNGALQDVAERNKIPLQRLPEVLAQQGIDYAAYRQDMRRELQLGILRQHEVLQKISVTPKEIDTFLERQSKLPNEHAEYNVSHILIAVGQTATPDQLDAAAKKAQDVYQRAKGGEDFGKLAVANSNSQTALEGGALGWRKGGELPTFLTDLVVKLKPGEVSEPLRTPTGFHIVRLNEIRDEKPKAVVEQVHARMVLMKTNELADDATVKQKLTRIRERIVKGEDFSGLAKVTSEDAASASQGGDLGWFGAGTYSPEFEAVLSGLKDNEISEPFRTQYGWHIVQMLGHRSYDNTEEVRRHEATDSIRNSKADEATELWLRKLRDEAYVEYKS
jgi:peptidyl-prolyl cis-trans isomerase SurA